MRIRNISLAATIVGLATMPVFGQNDPAGGDHTSMEKFEGADVVNRTGERIGTVSDFIFDPESDKLDFAVVDSGGFLGMGEKSFLVPWDAFQIEQSPEGGDPRLVLDATQEKLQGSPEYQEEEGAQIRPDEVFAYWGVQRDSKAKVEAGKDNPSPPPSSNPAPSDPNMPNQGQTPANPPPSDPNQGNKPGDPNNPDQENEPDDPNEPDQGSQPANPAPNDPNQGNQPPAGNPNAPGR